MNDVLVSEGDRTPVAVWRIAFATAGFYLFLVLGGVLCGAAAMAVAWLPPRGKWSFWVARWWGRGMLAMSGARVRSEGAEVPARPVVYMANHQSLFDIPALLVTMPGQARFLAKRSLFRIPIFGWALGMAGFVPVDRSDRRQGASAFNAALDRMRRGASIVVFPEETRSPDGRLLPFRRGGFLLARKLDAPLVPVGIRGSRAIGRKQRWWVRPGTIFVVYGREVSVASPQVRDLPEVIARVRQQVARLAATALASPDSDDHG